MTRINFPARIFRSGLFVCLLVSFASCNRDRNNPGWDYFPDMFYSTAYETNTKNPNFDNEMTMRVPVSGTVPRDFTPFEYTNDPDSRILAGKELVNPFLMNSETLLRGKAIYTTFCLGCHGIAGNGDGRLFTSGLYPLKPLSLSAVSAANLKDGEIYHTITLGIRSMGAHGSQIRPDDRWKLVLYIRKLQEEAAMGVDKAKQVTK
jgi:mono/diheme cytochrome c family protein